MNLMLGWLILFMLLFEYSSNKESGVSVWQRFEVAPLVLLFLPSSSASCPDLSSKVHQHHCLHEAVSDQTRESYLYF
jgi:hypothetical protein